MSQVPGLELLNAALEANRDCLVVVMTGNPSVSSSIEALRMGAWDYLPKPFSATHLQVLIGRASHATLKAREAADLRLRSCGSTPSRHHRTIASRRYSARQVGWPEMLHPPTPGLHQREEGTGKDSDAQFITTLPRATLTSFVNCAALRAAPRVGDVVHKRALTGATAHRDCSEPPGGTLFLTNHRDVAAAPGKAAPCGAGWGGTPGWRRNRR